MSRISRLEPKQIVKKIKIKPELLSLLVSDKHDTFTLTELTNAYLDLPCCHDLKKTTARQFVQRNIQRLEEGGFLDNDGQPSSWLKRYYLNDSFSLDCVIVAKPHRPTTDNSGTVPSDFSANLREKLNHHKLELLITVGEIEEYELIGSESPQRQEHIQKLYNRARDSYSKMRGRIRALESLISHF